MRSAPPPTDPLSLPRPEMLKAASPILALALVLGLIEPIAGHAQTAPEPSAAPPSSVAALPLPTVLRGSPPASAKPVPICPRSYALSPGYGCLGPSAGDYAEGWLGYDYWPDYGFGYPFAGVPGFGFGPGRFHRFARSHGFRGSVGFHGFATGIGHIGGFGRR